VERDVAPGDRLAAALAELDATERGFLLGISLLAGGDPQHPPVAVLAGAAGGRCRRAAAALHELPRAERLRWAGVLAREALAPVPPAIDEVHPEWLRRILEAESDDVVRLVAVDGPPALSGAAAAVLADRGAGGAAAPPAPAGALAEAVVELRRAVLAPIVPVPPLPAGVVPERRARLLLARPPADLAAEVGTPEQARGLGVALADAEEGDLLLALAQRLPLALARALLAGGPDGRS
jgi:alkylated DNA nucleotide flippase Atl1